MLIAIKIALTSTMLYLIFSWLSVHADELKLPTLAHKICLIIAIASLVTFICSLIAMLWLL